MDFEIGIVCGRCDLYSAMGTATGSSCGNLLGLSTRTEPATDPEDMAPKVVVTSVPSSRPAPVVAKSAYTEPPPSLLAEPLRPRRVGSSPSYGSMPGVRAIP